MSEHCRQSCGLCGKEGKPTKGEDDYDSVAHVVEHTGDPSSGMHQGDAASIERENESHDALPCEDLDDDGCATMAENNACLVHAYHMLRTCPATCQVCHLTPMELEQLLEASRLGVPQVLGPNEATKIGQVIRDAERAFDAVVKQMGSIEAAHGSFAYCRNRYVPN